MKLLLDENLPTKLKYRISNEYEVLTVVEMGWSAKENGELLEAMLENDLKYLLTSDKNMSFQQNPEKYGITLLVLGAKNNRYATLVEFIPNLEKKLKEGLKPGVVKINL